MSAILSRFSLSGETTYQAMHRGVRASVSDFVTDYLSLDHALRSGGQTIVIAGVTRSVTPWRVASK